MLTKLPIIDTHRFSRYYTTLEPFLAGVKVRAYTMFIFSFFALSFFGYFAIKPTLTTISVLKRQIIDARYVDQKLQEKINSLSEAQVAYESIKPDLEIIQTALPEETRFSPFVKGLEKMATESGISLVNLGFQPVSLSPFEATGSAKEIPIGFNLTLSGEYKNAADFVKRLTSFERLTTVEKMGLSADEKTISLILTGNTYYVPLK